MQPRQQIVPAARGGEKEGGRDLADVVHRGFLPLRYAERAMKRDGRRDRKGVIADPRHGQIAHKGIALVEVTGLRGLMHRGDQVPVLERHALGLTRRARGMEHYGPIVRAGTLQQRTGQLRRGVQPGFAFGQDGLIREEILGGVRGNASWVVVDDDLRRALLRPHLQELIGLLLILHDGDAHTRRDEISEFRRWGFRIKRHRVRAKHRRGNHAEIEPRPVIANDDGRLVALQPQCLKARRKRSHFVEIGGPAIFAPYAEFALPDSDPRRRLLRIPGEQREQRLSVRTRRQRRMRGFRNCRAFLHLMQHGHAAFQDKPRSPLARPARPWARPPRSARHNSTPPSGRTGSPPHPCDARS